MNNAAMGTVHGAWQLVFIVSAAPCGAFLDRVGLLAALSVALGAATILIQSAGGAPLATALVPQGIARSSMMTIAVLILMDTCGVDRKNAGADNGLLFSTAEIGGVRGPLTLGYVADLSGGFEAGL